MTETTTFEAAYARLETILEKMQENAVPLEEALKLYEEADRLISQCEKRLTDAQERIEILVKSRSGELTTQPFTPQQTAALTT